MREGIIRPIAVVAIRRPKDGKYLVIIREDQVAGTRFFRALGGGIEFGELAKDALKREIMEELNVEIIVGKQLSITEDIFQFENKKGHEIVFLFEAEFADKKIYDMEKIPVNESNKWQGFATWISLDKPAKYGVFPS